MDGTAGSPLRLEFAAFSVKSMRMTSGGNGIDRSGRGGRLLLALALACGAGLLDDRGPGFRPDVQRSAAAGAAGIGAGSALGAGDESGPAVGAGVDSDPARDR